MNYKNRPLPEIQPWTRPFWEGTKSGKLLIQRCCDCGTNIFFPKKRCPQCWSENLEWIKSSGKAKVYTFSIMRDMVEPVFRADLPYVLAMVDLKEGIRMTTRIVNCIPEDIHIGMEVDVVFENLSPECALPVFQPADSSFLVNPKNENTTESKELHPPSDGDYQTLRHEIGGERQSICTITLNRPEKFNAINRQMAMELIDAFRRIRDIDSVGVVILTGAGKAFCTGGDLEIFPTLAKHENSLNWLAHDGLDVQRAISSCEKIVICKINGHCLAGGLELALACDLLYAKASARFGTTEINMGLLPGWGGTARLPRSMPIFRAREIIYSGRKDYSARDMYEMGLLTRVYDDDAFDNAFDSVINDIASKKPKALRMGKEIMAKSVDGCDIETALAVERNGIQWLTSSPDTHEMIGKFASST